MHFIDQNAKGPRLQKWPSLLRIKHGIWRSLPAVLYIRHQYKDCTVSAMCVPQQTQKSLLEFALIDDIIKSLSKRKQKPSD